MLKLSVNGMWRESRLKLDTRMFRCFILSIFLPLLIKLLLLLVNSGDLLQLLQVGNYLLINLEVKRLEQVFVCRKTE